MRTFQIEDSSRTLILEDDDIERIGWFRAYLPGALIVRDPDVAMFALAVQDYQFVFLDFNVPGDGSGLDIAQYLADVRFGGQVVIHSSNRFGASLMRSVLVSAGIRTTVCQFGNFEVNIKSLGVAQ